MKKSILLLCFLMVTPLFAQRTQVLFPTDHTQKITGGSTTHVNFDMPNRPGGGTTPGWYRLQPPTGASGNGAFTRKYIFFKFPGTITETSYSGNADIVVRVDTTTIAGLAVGGRDSLYISAKPLFYDFEQNSYEISAVANQDSIVVGTSTGAGINWGTTQKDTKHLLRADMDVQLCQGVLVTVYAGRGGQVDVSIYVVISKTDGP